MIVLKFGGTSVRSLEMIDCALSIARDRLDSSPVLVSSAMGKTTDKLVTLTEVAARGNGEELDRSLAELENEHMAVIAGIEDQSISAALSIRVRELFQEARSLLSGVALIQECSPRTQDAVLSFGERIATAIIDARARDLGIDSQLLDSRELIETDEQYTAANVDFARTRHRLREGVHPRPGKLIILQGFIARSHEGVTSTLGRGGSDYTASIVAAAIGAERVEIWTDVNGIMTMDPRLVPEARTVDHMSYEEAAELAFFGARVVHPSTIQPAIDAEIPVNVRNTGDPGHPGTLISKEGGATGARALASKSQTTVVTIHSSRMLNAYGFLSRIFSVFERHRVSVDVVTTSEVSVSVTIDDPPDLTPVIEELSRFARVEQEDNQALICLVGRQLWKNSRTIATVFESLQEVPIRLISLGSSDVNLTLIVPGEALRDGIMALHNAFFAKSDKKS